MKNTFLLFFSFFPCLIFAQSLEDDRQALIALHKSTRGDQWWIETGWNVSNKTLVTGMVLDVLTEE